MYRARELRAKQKRYEREYGRRRGSHGLGKKIGGLCFLVFVLGFLFGRVVLAAEQLIEWENLSFVADVREAKEEGNPREDSSREEQETFSGMISEEEEMENISGYASGKEEPWNLRLVNFSHSLPEDFSVDLTEVGDGHQVDSRIAGALKEMIAAGKAEGYGIWIVSSYRTMEKQESLYERKVAQFQKQGYSLEEARRQAGTMVAVPGTSEHQLGLAVDLVSSEYTGLDERQEKTGSYQWLVRHCAEYGFILRYPNDKTEMTGIIYEPWHFRYVGVEAAREIMDQGICLEEYLEQKAR